MVPYYPTEVIDIHMYNIPEMKVQPLKRISPSKYFAIQSCLLRELWAGNNEIPKLLPLSPTVRVGTVVHNVLEQAVKGKVQSINDATCVWNEQISVIEAEMKENWIERHLVPISKYARQYEVKKQKCMFMVESFLNNWPRQSRRNTNFEAEVWLDTPDGKVGGRIDAVRVSDDWIEIIDYKTGNIFETCTQEQNIKQEYQQQLKLYAALFYAKRGVWPSKLTIVALNQKGYDILFNKDECLRLLNDAKQKLSQINGMITSTSDAESFAQPSTEVCRYCLYRPACKAYWKARTNTGEWPADFHGKVIDKKLQGNGLITIFLQSEHEKAIIRGLSPVRHPFLLSNIDSLYVCNLSRDTIPNYFEQDLLTTCYL